MVVLKAPRGSGAELSAKNKGFGLQSMWERIEAPEIFAYFWFQKWGSAQRINNSRRTPHNDNATRITK